MIKITSSDNCPLTFEMRVAGVAVYLDNFALLRFAGDRPTGSRSRFVNALHSAKASLLFSGTNGAELSAQTGKSALNVRGLLNEIGANWVFVESNPFTIMNREASGDSQALLSESLMQAFFQERMSDLSTKNTLLDMSAESFWRLGSVIDWMAPQRKQMIASRDELDTAIKARLSSLRTDNEKNPGSLDSLLPCIPYDKRRPATFAWNHLVRNFVIDAKQFAFKKGDGRDLCHAVVGSAYGSLAALDKPWRNRVRLLPQPNELARTYYQPELGHLIDDLEQGVMMVADENSNIVL